MINTTDNLNTFRLKVNALIVDDVDNSPLDTQGASQSAIIDYVEAQVWNWFHVFPDTT